MKSATCLSAKTGWDYQRLIYTDLCRRWWSPSKNLTRGAWIRSQMHIFWQNFRMTYLSSGMRRCFFSQSIFTLLTIKQKSTLIWSKIFSFFCYDWRWNILGRDILLRTYSISPIFPSWGVWGPVRQGHVAGVAAGTGHRFHFHVIARLWMLC